MIGSGVRGRAGAGDAVAAPGVALAEPGRGRVTVADRDGDRGAAPFGDEGADPLVGCEPAVPVEAAVDRLEEPVQFAVDLDRRAVDADGQRPVVARVCVVTSHGLRPDAPSDGSRTVGTDARPSAGTARRLVEARLQRVEESGSPPEPPAEP